MSDQSESLLTDLDAALAGVSKQRRLAMLQQITALFLANAAGFSAEQTAIFDAVMERLTPGIESKALAELSLRLAAMDSAPAETVARLSGHNDIAISGPVLASSNLLNDDLLVEIAKLKSMGHLMAIAGRRAINDAVTDVLVERGDPAVRLKVVNNGGAHLSETSFVRLINEASKDKKFASVVAKRVDIPAELQPFLDMAMA